MAAKDRIVLCIPGLWDDRSAFIRDVASGTEGQYLAAGLLIVNASQKEHVEFQFVEGTDQRMCEAFQVAAVYDPLSEREQQAIESHGSTLYLVSSDVGIEQARKMARFAAVICEMCGGLGVKVEVAGRAFSITSWLKRVDEIGHRIIALYDSFVFPLLGDTESTYFGCGMVQFGLPDTYVDGLEDPEEARTLIRLFDMYRLIDQPDVQSGHTFSDGEGGAVWKIDAQPHPYLGSEFLDYSPGVWRLARA